MRALSSSTSSSDAATRPFESPFASCVSVFFRWRFFSKLRSSVTDQFAEFHKTKWSFLQFLGTNCLKIFLPLLLTPYLLQPCTHFSQYFCHMRQRRRRIHCMSISISIAISIQPIIIPFSIYLFLQDDFVEDCNSQLWCKTSSLKIATNNFCKTSSLI